MRYKNVWDVIHKPDKQVGHKKSKKKIVIKQLTVTKVFLKDFYSHNLWLYSGSFFL